ncbi:sulfatase-like hydrolase/transferase [Flagellimonas allohymeniacidonis]|uniref:N-acetylgalactosamine-6-sulfatase n=1 Tax=Flagellimonas allohymeniacidonis TaxID=2517819 RepID=A0A4Q8QDA9_9FLAO|nr:sulfatase-like hydrolase/transferase [Allomuricauda hymeniacidonis]TAI48375.1 N-acetylgalactosamine-6-sulfatase [Allomuricauda hymeniacidonis]
MKMAYPSEVKYVLQSDIPKLMVTLLCLLLFFQAWAQHKDSTPNIVFIFADDLGYGDLGCFGATDIKTPNIDRLAQEGIKFTDFYSASSVCSPSRAALLAGRYPQRMGINNVFFPDSFTGMAQSEITLAELVKEKKYQTGIIGKWHLGHREKFLPLQQGFDHYFGIPYSNDMSSVVYMRNNEVVDYHVDQSQMTKTYTEEALSFIEKNKDNPFFLYVAHNMPHVPIHASEDFKNTSQRGLYGDVIEELDWSVGQILNRLESLRLLDNTIVVFTSDNGPWLVMEEYGGSAGILREGKQFTFDGGMRVPTVAMWKKRVKPGIVYDGLATQMDWFPTFAHLLDIPIPNDREIDGSDISAVLLQSGKRMGNTFLFFDGSRLQAFREGKWKIKKPYKGTKGSPWQKPVAAHDTLLFDLSKDPGEMKNLYQENKSLALELFSKMEQEYRQLGPLPKSLIVTTGKDNSHFEYLKGKKE